MASQRELENWIVYEDRSILVLDKPAGIAVESARVTEPDLMSLLRVRQQLAGGGSSGVSSGIFMVHRLDQPVSGMIVFAKHAKAAAFLSAQLTDGRMKKIYHATVCGEIPSEEGTLIDYLESDPRTNLTRVVSTQSSGKPGAKNSKNKPKKAVLRYKKIGEQEVEVELETGRRHQIRVQLAHAGMPIAGDRKYGSEEARKFAGDLALRAFSLTFIHPDTKKTVTFQK